MELQGDIEKRNIIAVIDQLKNMEYTINYGKLNSLIDWLDDTNPDIPRIKKAVFKEIEKVEKALYKIKHSI